LFWKFKEISNKKTKICFGGGLMNISKLLLGLICVSGISIGQIFFKLAALSIAKINANNTLWHYVLNTNLLIALFIYILTTGLWVWLLRVVPLKQAYPLFALAFFIVPLLGALFLHEKFELKTAIGGVFIVLGVYISVK
jgi:drug/metabolite transporter (DMT)-like permease